MTNKRLVITIDGPASSGKSTLAKALAAHFKLPFLDTGLLYRAVARRIIDHDVDPGDLAGALDEARALRAEDLDESRLRGEGIGNAASAIAVAPEIRAALLPFQQRFAQQTSGAVLAGRDTGTVICPDAAVKFFVIASIEARAERRFKELQARGDGPIYEQVLAELRERDARDQGREFAPLCAADDAVSLDTTELGVDEARRLAVRHVESRIREMA
jgi:cytidylate kinase